MKTMNKFLAVFSIALIGITHSAWALGLGEKGSADILREAKIFQNLTDRIFWQKVIEKPDQETKVILKVSKLPYLKTIE